MRVVVFLFLCALAVSSLAAIKTVTGYGSGDDFKEALAIAAGDAIVNAGTKAQVLTEVDHDRLVADKGEHNSEAYLLSYEIIEKGEAFDGSYMRIKARVSDSPDFELKDGTHVVEGVGRGRNRQESENLAVADAIIKSGTKIRVRGKYQNDELVEDCEDYDAVGVVGRYSVVSNATVNGAVEVTVSVLVHKNVDDLLAGEVTATYPCDGGQETSRSVALKRCHALLDLVSVYDVHTKYASGKRGDTEVSRKCHVFFTQSNASTLNVSASDAHQAGRLKAVGYGSGDTMLAAICAAKCNAVLWYGAEADIGCSYLNGRKVSTTSKFKGGCCIRSFEVLDMRKGANGYEARVSVDLTRSPETTAQCPVDVVVNGYGDKKESAIEDAKRNALDKVFGKNVRVVLAEKNGNVISQSMTGEYVGEGFVSEFEELSAKKECGTHIVQIKAVVRTEPEEESFLWKAIKFIWYAIVTIVVFIAMVIWWILQAIWGIICWFFGLFF